MNNFQKGSSWKNYVVAAVVVLALVGVSYGVLVKGKSLGLTGAIFSDNSGADNSAIIGGQRIPSTAPVADPQSASQSVGLSDVEIASKVSARVSARLSATGGVSLVLTSDAVPSMRKEATIEQMEVKFSNLNTDIKVNKEALDVASLDNVDLKITGFTGSIGLDQQYVSLDGVVSRIQVNGVALSSPDLKLSLKGIEYEYLNFLGIELKDLDLSNGGGRFEAEAGKITSRIDQKDRMYLTQWYGNILIDKSIAPLMTMNGAVKSLSMGGTVNLVLQ